MNTFLESVWEERVARLRLGIDPVDALGALPGPTGVAAGLAVHLERVPLPHPLPVPIVPDRPDPGIGLPRVRRGPSGRFPVLFGRDDAPRVTVRIVDRAGRYVPRRLSVPVPDLAEVLAAEPDGPPPARACRPVLFPGAAYPVAVGATAVRGRVTWGASGPPVQWARVEAAPTGTAAVTWRAHGDAQGEFLLLIGPLTGTSDALPPPVLAVDVTVHARRPPGAQDPVDSPARSRGDPLWHLPVEEVGGLVAGDPVADGTVLPPGYTVPLVRTVPCRRGGTVVPAPFVLA